MRVLYVSATFLSFAFFGAFLLLQLASNGAVVEPQVLGATSSPVDRNVSVITDEINKVRSGVGAEELVYSLDLQNLTDFRVSDMVARDYYSHKTPDGYTYANYIAEYDSGSTYSCENLQLQVGSSPEEAVEAWVNSPSHYRCLTNPNVSNIAVSYSPHGEVVYGLDNQPQQMFVFALVASN